MATSNSYNYSATAADIITEALEIIGALAEGGAPNAAQTTSALRTFNMMIKGMMADDLQLWVAQRATLFPLANTATYAVGPTGDKAVSTYVKTSLSSAASSGATSIVVDSATGIANGNNIGVILADGTSHWTTVSGAPVGTTVTLAMALTGSANSGARVYCYAASAAIQRPLRILDMWRHSDSDADAPMRLVSRQEYDHNPGKLTEGLPSEACYNPFINSGPATSNGELQVWPVPSDLTELIQFRYTRPIQDVDTSTDEVDFPQEWFEALALELAYRLSHKYGLPVQEKYLLRKDAQEAYRRALDFSQEFTSVYLQPGNAGDGGF